MARLRAVENWDDFADRLLNLGATILDSKIELDLARTVEDPKFMGLALLARTMSNFQAVRTLLSNGHILEARVIARCCHENLFWVAALAKRGSAFVDEMFEDGSFSILKQEKRLLAWVNQGNENYDSETAFVDPTDEVNGGHDKPRAINHHRAATEGGVQDAYISYGNLSSDAAHPSVMSLIRHMSRTPDGRAIIVRVKDNDNPNEPQETLGLTCEAVLNVCIEVDRIIGETVASEILKELNKEYRSLLGVEYGIDARAEEQGELTSPSRPYTVVRLAEVFTWIFGRLTAFLRR
jgi:hypothetical protein